jgi:hypothetical protein
MYFSKFAIVLSFAATAVVAAPVQKRAGILTVEDYSVFQVSGGVAGNAQTEVEDHFNVSPSCIGMLVIPRLTIQQFAAFKADLAGVSANDLAILQAARVVAENAETGTGGFNDAIAAAGSSSAAGKALQVG